MDVESNPLEKIGAIGVRLVMAEVAYNRVARSIPMTGDWRGAMKALAETCGRK